MVWRDTTARPADIQWDEAHGTDELHPARCSPQTHGTHPYDGCGCRPANDLLTADCPRQRQKQQCRRHQESGKAAGAAPGGQTQEHSDRENPKVVVRAGGQ